MAGKPQKIRHRLFYIAIFLSLASCFVVAETLVPENPDHSWHAPQAPHSLLVALDQMDEQVFAVGARGHVLRASSSSLADWRQSDVQTQVLLNAIQMVDQDRGWAVGHDAIILATRDGGKTWLEQHKAIVEERPVLVVWFSVTKWGFAIGAFGYFMATIDGGNTWYDRIIHEEHDYHLNAIADNGMGKLFIAAESGYVYRSHDGGENWQVLNPPYRGSFFAIAADGDTVIVVGLRGHVFLSTDAGENWQAVDTGIETTLTSIQQVNDEQFVVVGHAGVVLLLDIGSGNVSLYRQAARNAFSDVVLTRQHNLVMAGEHGISLRNLCQVFDDKLNGVCP